MGVRASGSVFGLDLTNGGTIGGDVTINGHITVGSGKQIKLPNGSIGAPSLSWSSDLDSGLYRDSFGAQELVKDGAAVLSASAAGGSIATPAVVAVQGRFAVAAESTKTVSYTATDTDSLVIMNVTAAGTLTLPAAPGGNQMLWVKNVGGASLTIARNGKTIDEAAADLTLAIGAQALLTYDGIGWYRLSA